jgi:hypothetical protein
VVVKSGEKKNLQIRTTRFKIARFNLYLLSFLSYNLERQSMKNVLAHKTQVADESHATNFEAWQRKILLPNQNSQRGKEDY